MFCLEKAPLVLPAEGAPLVFSTDIAHDFVLHIEGKMENRSICPPSPIRHTADL